MSDRTHLDQLKYEMEKISPQLAEMAPGKREKLTVLKEAVQSVAKAEKSKVLFVDLDDKSGIAVIEQQTTEGTKPGDAWGKVSYVVKFVDGLLDMDPYDSEKLSQIVDCFNESLAFITPAMTGRYAVDLCKSLGGSCLRPGGGIYWLHESALETWKKIADAFHLAGNSKSMVYLIRHQLDLDSVRAVFDAVMEEATADLEKISAEVKSGNLGEKALVHREHQCQQIVQRLATYEEYLGVSLQTLKDVADQMLTTQAIAALQADIQAELQPN